MDTTEVTSLLEDLSGNVDDLESSLEPLLKTALSSTTSRLPLLDKAKLYVLATYAIESILFSYLRLNGVDAKEHAVFRELTRVKEYFEKIKAAEAGPEQRTTSLDKGAAIRFIKQGLAGNDSYDRGRIAREQQGGKRKMEEMQRTSQWGNHNRFEGTAKRMRAQDETMIPVVRASDVDESVGESSVSTPSATISKADKKAAKRQRRLEARLAKQSPASSMSHQIADEADSDEAAVALQSPSDTVQRFENEIPGLHQDAQHGSTKKGKKRKTRGEKRQELEDRRAREMA